VHSRVSLFWFKISLAKKKSPTEELEAIVVSLENKSTLDVALMWKDTTKTHSPNQSLFEVVEKLECLLDNASNIVDSRLTGTIFATCLVPGSNEVSVSFKTSFPMVDYCLHKNAVLANSTEQFKNLGIVRFYPLDSTIELIRYNIENLPISLPFNITYDLLNKPDYLNLSIIVSPVMVQGEYLKVNNFALILNLPSAFSSQSLAAAQSVFIFDDKKSVLSQE